MKKTGIFYGSTTGTTEEIARKIAKQLGVADGDVHDAAKLTEALVNDYEILLLGTSTWGDGDLQDDWYDAVKVLQGMDLSSKVIALFGCGDSDSYTDTFCDGMGILYNDLQATGAKFCGFVSTDGYTFDNSIAVADGKFVGLAIDEVNEDGNTDERIAHWVDTLKNGCL